MRGKRSSGYGTARFSADAVISLILGIVGWILFVISIVKSIMTGGKASAIYGFLFIAATVCAVWGAVFSVTFWNAEEGTLGFKRFLVLFNFILLVLAGALILRHFFG